MMKKRLFRLGAAVAAASVALSLSACAPGPTDTRSICSIG